MASRRADDHQSQRIVVFGATSAIAEALQRLWAKRGDELFLVARNGARLEEIASDLRVRGARRVETFVQDLGDLAGHEALIARINTAAERIDVVFIAHGLLGDQARAERDFAHAQDILATNLTSPASLISCLAPRLEAQRHGTIAVLGSVAGDRGRATNFTYAAAKAGIAAFASGLRQRLAASNVHVVLIKPGPIQTPMTAHLEPSLLWSTPAAIAPGILRAIERGSAVAHAPWWWGPIMLIVRNLPERIFWRIKA